VLTIYHITDTHIDNNDRLGYVQTSYQWILDNWENLGSCIVLHSGDVVNRGYNEEEFTLAEGAMDMLYNAGVPLLTVPGNHDYDLDNDTDWSAATRGLDNFNGSFGLDNYNQQAWFGGSYGNGAENVYFLLSEGGEDWLFLGLEYRPRDDTLAWADGILKDYPDRKVVIITHEYLDGAEEAMRRASGEKVWEDLVYPNGNVDLVLCGHCLGSVEGGTHTDGARRFDYNSANRSVGQFYHNWQAYSHQNNFEDYMGDRGEGRFRKHKWDENSEIQVESFCPEHSEEEEDYMQEYLTSARHQFTYDFPLGVKPLREYDYDVDAETYDAQEQANADDWLTEGRARILPPPFPNPGQAGLKFSSVKRAAAEFSDGTYMAASDPVFGTGAFSAMLLLKVPTEPSVNAEVMATAFGTATQGVRLWVSTAGNLTFRTVYGSSGNWNFSCSVEFPFDGRFHVVYLEWTGNTFTNGAKLFLDDMVDPVSEDTAVSGITSHSENLHVGRASDRDDRYFPAGSQVAGLAVFNTRLGETERRRHANLLLSGKEPDCRGYWRMDEGSGWSVFNYGGAGADGDFTFYSSGWANVVAPATWVQFTDRVFPAQVGGHALTIMFELTATRQPAEENQEIMATVFSTADSGIRFWISTAGNLSCYATYGTSGSWAWGLTHALTFNNDRKIVCLVWDGSTTADRVRLYVDDMETPVAEDTAETLHWHNEDLVIGRAADRNERYSDVEVANLAVFDREIMASLRAHYAETFEDGNKLSGTETGLIHYYPMDQHADGFGTVKDDVNNADGKVYGGTFWTRKWLFWPVMPFREPYWQTGYTNGTYSYVIGDDAVTPYMELEVSGSGSQITLLTHEQIDLTDYEAIALDLEYDEGADASIFAGLWTGTNEEFPTLASWLMYYNPRSFDRRVIVSTAGITGTRYVGVALRGNATGTGTLRVHGYSLQK